jgi:glycosyltransferase involved in cell wall biosynthesis
MDNAIGVPLRIVHLIDSLSMGGAERMIVTFSRYLRREAFALEVCCLQEPGPLAKEVEAEGVSVTAMGQKNNYDPVAFPRLVRFLRRGGFHLVHTHLFGADFWGRLASIFAGVPIRVSTIHSPYVDYQWKNFAADRTLARWTDHFIAVSRTAMNFTINKVPIPPEKFTWIPNPVPAELFVNPAVSDEELDDFCATWSIDRGAPVIGTIGRLSEQKGHVYLVEAARHVIEQVPEAQFVIVGDGPKRSELEEDVRRLGLANRVIFVGVQQNPLICYRLFDLFVLSSLWEGTPLVLIEAMMAGLPVVATSVDGVKETLVHEETGLLVPPKDPGALAQAMLLMLQDISLRSMLTKRARDVAVSTFDAPGVVRQYEVVYEECLARAGRRRIHGAG